jgi:hypothetical protein
MYSCSIHVRFMFDSCSIHVRFMFDSCSIHVRFMFDSCVHVQVHMHAVRNCTSKRVRVGASQECRFSEKITWKSTMLRRSTIRYCTYTMVASLSYVHVISLMYGDEGSLLSQKCKCTGVSATTMKRAHTAALCIAVHQRYYRNPNVDSGDYYHTSQLKMFPAFLQTILTSSASNICGFPDHHTFFHSAFLTSSAGPR